MKSIEISNFKNFRHLKIDNLGMVNLIVGKNNVGKSTLLEAISILASGGNSGWLKKILEIRGLNSNISADSESLEQLEVETLCSLSYGRNLNLFKENPIYIKSAEKGSDGNCLEITLKDYISITETGEDGLSWKKLVPRGILGDAGNMADGDPILCICICYNGNRSIYPLYQFFSRRTVLIDKSVTFEYVRTTEFSGDKNPALFDKIALSPLEGELLEGLRIIDPHIVAINFLNDESRAAGISNRKADQRVPYVVCDNMEGKYRLSAMGDGVNRILTIILSMLNCKDGILLVDEFENGLHYSVQTAMWSLICRLAKKLNIQVFATTHSQDCIRSFLQATNGEELSQEYGIARLVRLEKRLEKEVAIVYEDSDELEYISRNDIETR
ncbi:MAG: AAA family ATPase [Muribaculaceae bacterium]|nr:AAA family ATPase [Muribaculaceae bacterium]